MAENAEKLSANSSSIIQFKMLAVQLVADWLMVGVETSEIE